ncbi:hypothetical protein F7725_010620 [Dissostichus mawsoni]|uniref:NTF2 domain-containing protein n=1 Tax=Dissostichus mawsoni TaxID=36200 RepID=A0A7J5XP11_DISMA|nr:hypothetical protein F7725_010620 [Dissostichus mawsoni]
MFLWRRQRDSLNCSYVSVEETQRDSLNYSYVPVEETQRDSLNYSYVPVEETQRDSLNYSYVPVEETQRDSLNYSYVPLEETQRDSLNYSYVPLEETQRDSLNYSYVPVEETQRDSLNCSYVPVEETQRDSLNYSYLKPVTEHSTARCEAATGDSKKSLVSKSSTFLKINPLLTKEMVMEKPSAQLVGREFVRQYYTLLNQAPDYLHRFYGKNSSYVHGGLDNNGKPAEAVYGQSGTVANKFYVHNDVFRYQDEVFGDSDSEPPEESEDEVEEIEERIPSPDIAQEDSAPFYDPTPCSEPTAPGDDEEVAASPEPEPEEEKEVEWSRSSFRGPSRRQSPHSTVREGEQGETESRRVVRYPDAQQLFVGNVPHDLRINSGGKLPNFGFVVFDDSEPVQKILSNRPIMFRGSVRLNVEEKKTRSAREGDRRDVRPRGPGGPGGPRERIGGGGGGGRGGGGGPPTRGGMAQKPSFGSGRGAGPSESRYPNPRQ